ncbi:MAG: acyltransferase [Candidatus Pacebacteria bacterium]|nr:acyltransferase [Candidatus Paceibacterota bacterium]
MKSKIFIPELNSLRFFAAIAIVIFHFGRWSYPFDNSTYPLSFNLAVSFFFVLSGFIMATVYNDLKTFSFKEALNFYLKRFVRIVPLYIVALILTVFFINNGFTLKEFFLNLFFLQAWTPEHALSLNFPGWSLSTEMFFYLLFPFVFPFITNRKKLFSFTFIFWILSNLAVFVLCYFNYDVDFIKYYPLFHLNEFLIGIWAGLTYLKGINKKGLLFFFGSLLFLFFYFPLVPDYNIIHHDGLLAPIFALLILGASKIKSIILSSKLLIKLGDASYGIYILQFPIYLIVYKLYTDFNVFDSLGEEGRFYIYLVILILISYLSSVTFEKWMKKVFLRKVA